MREIKFRQINNGTTHYWGYIDGMGFVAPMASADWHDVVSDQYTGLKDKNGKEIYEGDIVKSETDDEDSAVGNVITTIAEVCYGQHSKAKRECNYLASFTLYSTDFYDEHAIFYKRRWTHEVIGNIYENPDLL